MEEVAYNLGGSHKHETPHHLPDAYDLPVRSATLPPDQLFRR